MQPLIRKSQEILSGNIRYLILALLFGVTTLNYADRATFSVTAPAMKAEFGFTQVEIGYLFSAFSWAYVLAQIPGGALLDRFGVRLVYAVSIALWSLFTLLQSSLGFVSVFGSSVATLFLMRFMVGLAEAPAFPGNAKMTADWFPTTERGTASAIFNSAQYFAPVVFTPLMAWLTHSYSWHYVYLVMGLLGFVVTAIWLKFARKPEDFPSISQRELTLIRENSSDGVVAEGDAQKEVVSIGRLLRSRMFLGIYIAQYCINSLTYFFLTWFPVYLVEQRGMSILKAGFVTSLPAICGFLGGVLGGVISDQLLRRGLSLTAARKIPIVAGLLLSTSIVVCNYVDNDVIVVAIMALAFFGKGVGALGWAVVADTAPKTAIGLSGGLFNTFGNIAGIVTPIVIGYILMSTGSFNGALVYVALNAVIAIASYLFLVGTIKRADFRA